MSVRELAHQRTRDRKRTTRMVVDNAGVKRILLAQRDRAAQRAVAKAGRPAAGVGQDKGQATT